MREGLTFAICCQEVDPAWDEFVASAPAGEYLQSSLWAAFKARMGWSPIRIILKADSCIVAGAQVLVRQLPFGLKFADVLQGPVLRSYEPELFNLVLDQLVNLVQTYKINYLTLQPGCDCGVLSDLNRKRFQDSPLLRGGRATLQIDLSQGSRSILHQMRRTTRDNIGRAENQGIRIRAGKQEDLTVFHQLLEATARRQKFTAESREYYLNLWETLEPSKQLKLFISEYQDEVLSALLAIPFGNTVRAKKFVWSGGKGWLRPNELLLWKAIEWSKENGFLKFNLGGIEPSAAQAHLCGTPLPEPLKRTPSRFLLGFGGQIVLLPPTYEYIPNRALRMALQKSTSLFSSRSLVVLLQNTVFRK
jgi:lipid II:glycine glycyltransferase (peptidoglycan interpeptide bridge formation enzyme)